MSYGENHPSKRILGTDSNKLKGKNILLGITGSVAAFLSPKIARELIRHGANVIPVISADGLKMIGADMMWWATGNKPITEITGELEHIRVVGVMNDPVDLMLILPCTTNTVAKLYAGIADTPVTLIASSLSGKKIPIMILPVAHEDLINSPAVLNALKGLEDWGYQIIKPVREEGKAKVPDIENIIFEIMHRLIEKELEGKKVIITGGPTREHIDNVRYITNEASGRTSISLATEAFYQGADVTLVLGPTNVDVPPKIDTVNVKTSQEMTDQVLKLLVEHPDAIVILSAAMGDFTPKEKIEGKIKSGEEMRIELKPTTKLSDSIKINYPNTTLILFKAEWEVTKEELIERAREKLIKCNADLIIANDLAEPGAGFQTINNHVFLISKEKELEMTSLKSELSETIIEMLKKDIIQL